MNIPYSLPLDGSYLRRQCHSCGREFKWRHGSADNQPDHASNPPDCHCPYCGRSAGHDSWWTDAQIKYIERLIERERDRMMAEGIRGLSRRRQRGGISVTFKREPDPVSPAPLVEPRDMVAVASPCHPHKPIKIVEDWDEPVHCLVCGQLFAVS